jgi:nicotinamidase-related amidase
MTPANDLARLGPKQCCLLVIDPQERLMAHIHGAAAVERNICLMIRLAQVFSLPIIACTQYKKGIGPLVPGVAELLDGVPCPDKIEFNALAGEEVRNALDALPPAVDTLLVCGVETHICIYQTALGALRAGYAVRVVADGVSSRTPENHALGLARLRELGALVMPAEMIIYELLGKAGTPEFKAMFPHLK